MPKRAFASNELSAKAAEILSSYWDVLIRLKRYSFAGLAGAFAYWSSSSFASAAPLADAASIDARLLVIGPPDSTLFALTLDSARFLFFATAPFYSDA